MLTVGERGGWVGLEHPEDPKCEPFPSFFNTDILKAIQGFLGLAIILLHQCMFGGPKRKPTNMMISKYELSRLKKLCCHPGGHGGAIGLTDTGQFHTTPLALYPSALSRALASCIVDSLALAEQRGQAYPFKAVEKLVHGCGRPEPRESLPPVYLAGGFPDEVLRRAGRIQW